MGVTVQLTEAGHSWGYDHFYDARSGYPMVPNAGYPLSVTYSWNDDEDPPLGVDLEAAQAMSAGFTVRVGFRLNSYVDAQINFISVSATSTGEVLEMFTGPLAVSASNLLPSPAVLMGGADTLIGNSFANVLQGWGGNDQIEGGAGLDVALFSGLAAGYSVVRSGSAITVTGFDGTDHLSNVERLGFSDKRIAFDTEGTAGQAYRLYQAAFDRAPDEGGLGFQIRALDAGWGLKDIAKDFLASPEFGARYGNLDNTQYITALYNNVLHRAPEAAGLAYHSEALVSGLVDRAQLLINFSESPENQAALIGVIAGGMTYIG
jgi:hypothetical protein